MTEKKEYRTKQKAEILACLEAQSAGHLTAAELLQALNARGTHIGAATVYRQLERLEAQGLVRRYALDDRGSACWQYTGDSETAKDCQTHFHLKCTKCGTLFHLDCEHLNEIAHHVAADHGFRIDPARTVFYGICAVCANANQSG